MDPEEEQLRNLHRSIVWEVDALRKAGKYPEAAALRLKALEVQAAMEAKHRENWQKLRASMGDTGQSVVIEGEAAAAITEAQRIIGG